MTTARDLDMATVGSATTVLYGMEVHMEIGTGNSDAEDQRIQDKFQAVLQSKLGSNKYVVHTAIVNSFWGVLTDVDRRVVSISRGSRGTIAFVMECPTVESQHHLEKLCASGGQLVQLAQRICTEDSKFQQFHKLDIKVSMRLKGDSTDQGSPVLAQYPAPAAQDQVTPESLLDSTDHASAVPTQPPAPAVQDQVTPESLRVKCDRLAAEMVEEFNKKKPRLVGSTGLGGTGVNVMMAAYLTKWKILDEIDIQQVTNEMLIRAKQAEKLLELLRTRSAKHLVMFARALRKVGLQHQLNCLEKTEDRWIFKNTDEEMYARLNEIYPDDSSDEDT